jgi:hypothetical protein
MTLKILQLEPKCQAHFKHGNGDGTFRNALTAKSIFPSPLKSAGSMRV